jgi:hypothetical protein
MSTTALPANRDPGALGEGSVRRIATAIVGALLLAATCFTVLGGDDKPSVLIGVNTEAKKRNPIKMGLWEDEGSPHHNPYYNIFSGEEQNDIERTTSHRDWNSEQVGEKKFSRYAGSFCIAQCTKRMWKATPPVTSPFAFSLPANMRGSRQSKTPHSQTIIPTVFRSD